MKSKKSVELTTNLIIIFVILIVTAVIVIAVFSKQTGSSVGVLNSCGFKGGTCKPNSCDAEEKELDKAFGKCKLKTEVCCVKIGGEQKT